MLRKFVLSSAVMFAVSISGVTTAAAESFDYLFGIRLGIAKIGEMRITGSDENGKYATTGKLYTTGVAGALYDLNYEYSAKGDSSDHWHVLPSEYSAKIHENGYDRRVKMAYDGDKILSIVTDPAEEIPANMHEQRGTVDPMTLIYLLLRPVPAANVCGGTYTLYDGATRFVVSYANARRYNDGRVECDIKYSGNGGGVSVSGITFDPGSDGMMHIENFEIKTGAGTLKATRR